MPIFKWTWILASLQLEHSVYHDTYYMILYREAVESCERWAESTTQQVDLVFNIFFAVYFFIRVGRRAIYIMLATVTRREGWPSSANNAANSNARYCARLSCIMKTKLAAVSLSCKNHHIKTANIKILYENSTHRRYSSYYVSATCRP